MKGMFDTLINAFKLPELRKKILFTIFILVIYQIGGLIPAPGLDREVFTNLVQNWGQLGSMMDIISGGGLFSATIFAMGITPYINSSIIIQLLTVVFPSLQEMSKDGEAGKKKMQKIVRFTAIGLALVQASMFTWTTRSAMTGTLPKPLNAILIAISFTAGTCIIVWLGERINEKGIGNGVSLMIFTGIVTRLPRMASEAYTNAATISGKISNNVLGIIVGVLIFVAIAFVALAIIVFVLFVQNAERRIPVQYSKKTVGRKLYGGQSSYIPIKVNQSGVMPVIFSMSILSLPNMIGTLFLAKYDNVVANWFRNFGTSPFYYVFDFILIIAFTFFYSLIQFNPGEISNSIQKNGGFIPGIRPGKPTKEYIAKTASRLNWIDGLFLAFIVLVPTLVASALKINGVWFVGTSVLILTGVANDLVTQIESQLVTRNYRGFLD
ncbi:MAG: preprotein translocase subunit SecY [Clostridia bacterium]|nr:preprotein translocase subunit SecY [Clostridia bacterium]